MSSIQFVSYCFPEYSADLVVHLYRNRQDDPGIFHFTGYRHVLQGLRRGMYTQDVEYLG